VNGNKKERSKINEKRRENRFRKDQDKIKEQNFIML
jgi:hypothetical protein